MIGRTFSDAAADVHFTPLARGQAGTSVWMEVEINLGTQASNHPPAFRLEVEQNRGKAEAGSLEQHRLIHRAAGRTAVPPPATTIENPHL